MKRRAIPVSADQSPLLSKPKNVDTLPRLIPLPKGPNMLGPCRSWFYREEKLGNIRLPKIGRSTYIDTETALARIAALKSVSEAA